MEKYNKKIFNTFTPEILTWTILSLNLDMSTAANIYLGTPLTWSFTFLFQTAPQTVGNLDPFNMSNDEFYNPRQMDTALRSNIGVNLIQVCYKFMYGQGCGNTMSYLPNLSHLPLDK